MSWRDRLGGNSKGSTKGIQGAPEADGHGRELTPLERYLARKKAEEQAESTFEDRARSRNSLDKPAKEAPKEPGKEPVRETPSPHSHDPVAGNPETPSSGSDPAAPVSAKPVFEPGGFWPRFAAFVIDGLIMQALHWPAAKAVMTVLVLILGDWATPLLPNLDSVLYLVIAFFYFGWFYSERGATPGKIALGLEVVADPSGRRIGYWRAFLRETLGKFISGLPLSLGFIIAGLRSDRRALHDLIFETRVVKSSTQKP